MIFSRAHKRSRDGSTEIFRSTEAFERRSRWTNEQRHDECTALLSQTRDYQLSSTQLEDQVQPHSPQTESHYPQRLLDAEAEKEALETRALEAEESRFQAEQQTWILRPTLAELENQMRDRRSSHLRRRENRVKSVCTHAHNQQRRASEEWRGNRLRLLRGFRLLLFSDGTPSGELQKKRWRPRESMSKVKTSWRQKGSSDRRPTNSRKKRSR